MKKKLQGLIFRCILAFLCLMPGLSFAQNIKVEGSVIDETGEALIGVSVVLKGSTGVGTATDVDGRFVLSNIPSSGTLVFNYLGYSSKEVKVTGGVMNVKMDPDTQLLDEVVVIAYGQQKKVTVTGAVSSIGSKELLKSPAASLGNVIAGKLPGVQSVQYSGLPGADDPVIRIRGIGTFNGSAQEPLVLVDGVERPFTQIDANEVADFSILKDASATAVFGVRGANGVILITTKRGTTGKPSVSVTTSAGIQQITHFIESTDSYTYATAYNNAQLGDGVLPTNLKFKPEALRHFKDKDMPLVYPDTDWLNYIMKNSAWQSQHNVNVSGGTDIVKYFVSVGIFDQDGLFKTFSSDPESNFKYRRYNYRANLDINLSKKSTLSVNVGGRVENRNIIGGGEQELFRYLQQAVPYAGYGLDSEGRHIVSDPSLVGEYQSDGLGQFYNLGYVKASKNVLNLDLSYTLKLDMITKGLEFKVKGSYNSEYTQNKNRKNGAGSGITYQATLRPGVVDENGDPKVVLLKSGDTWPLPYSESREGTRDWYSEASFNYSNKFGDHNVGALVLYNQSKTYYPRADEALYVSIPSGYVGIVGRVTYDYNTKYLVDFNMGYNGSENFASDKRYGFFPSAALGWIPSSEDFWEPVKEVVSYLKLRASLGKVGNDKNNRRFLYLPSAYSWINGGPGTNYGGTANFGTNNNNWLPGARESTTGNPFIKWETSVKQNYGVDINFFRDRLRINVDVFSEERSNILASNSAVLPSILGIQSNSVNYGSVKNNGYEIVVKWEDKINDFQYSIAPSLSYVHNKITKMMEIRQDYDHLYTVGNSVGQPFGYDFFEFYDPGQTEKRYQEKYGAQMPTQGVNVKAGDCIFVDLTGDGKIDSNDRKAIGFTDIPEYNGSINMSFSYKGFDLSMLWIGATNVNRKLDTYYRPQFGTSNLWTLLQWVHDNSWREDHIEGATLPRLTFDNQAYNTYDSKVWLVDASFARLKNMEIGYTFNKIPKIPQIGSVRIYATGYNLLTFSKFKANDPESSGAAYGTFMKYPMTRVYNLGLKVNF